MLENCYISPESVQDIKYWDIKKENPLSIIKWDLRFLGLAKYVSSWSFDPSTKVGAAIVDNKNRIVSIGFNGFARGIPDNKEDYSDRDTKIAKIIHGEMNAILFANRSLEGLTLYTYPFLPCSRCAQHVIQVGIKRVVAPALFGDRKIRWEKDVDISKKSFREANVEFIEYNHEDLIVDTIRSQVDVESD